jgi:hypothetical protein
MCDVRAVGIASGGQTPDLFTHLILLFPGMCMPTLMMKYQLSVEHQ